MSRKPRADSSLKTLPPERQAAIADYARDHTLTETVAWLKDDGLKTSSGALSGFLSWWDLRQQLRNNASTVEAVLKDLKSSRPEMTPEQLDSAGQMFFTALAIERKDSLSWKRAQDIKIKGGALKLLERRIKLLEEKAAKADAAAKVTGNKALTREEKEAEYKRIFGM